MNLQNLPLILLSQPTSDVAGADPMAGLFSTLLMFAPMILIIYFLIIRPNKKRSKADKAMRDNIQIADEVVTSGGIIGRVLSIKDDTVLIETGGDRTRIRFLRSAIIENRTIHD
jgi:preprotein translocase subunit YajC